MASFWLITTAAIILLYIIKKIKSIYSFWEGTGLPYHGFFEYMKSFYESFTLPYDEYIEKLYKKHGRVFGSFQLFTPTLMAGDPEIIKQVSIKDFGSFQTRNPVKAIGNPYFDKMVMNQTGDAWKHTRDVMSPAFTGRKMRQMVKLTVEICENTTDTLIEAAKKNQDVRIAEVYGYFSLDNLARLAFGLKVNSQKEQESEFVVNSKQVFGLENTYLLLLQFYFPSLLEFFKLSIIRVKFLNYFGEIAKTVIQRRRNDEKQKEAFDTLQLLINALEEQKNKPKAENRKEDFDEDSVIAQSVLFLVAGFHTVGTAISFCAYYLALHPEIQDKLIEEIDEVPEDEELTYERLMSLKHLEGVVSESLRMSSPVPILIRCCTHETKLAGIKFRVGDRVCIPISGIHQDPEFYPEPEKFKPERFFPENKKSLVPYTYLPFGIGPRDCIGMRIALFSTKIALFRSLQKIKFQTCAKTPRPLKMHPRSPLAHPDPPIILRVVERQKS